MGKKNNCWGYCWTIEQMGIWKSVGKESNAQNGISSKKEKKKKKKEEETVKGEQEKKMRKKKMRSHQQISWLCCKTFYCSYRKIRKTWFSELGIGTVELGGVEPLKREEMMRERQRDRERHTEKVRKIYVW